ncbi:unnamed protein product [Leptidea sinapis]|uniref:Uncharacterized protein n=1 Tax=Leptidea sinapis TaxID=189913 RepID=A0A5E4QV99_9NEOP|nr:unnamed protein product [Leptidea sinapis]
MANKTATIFLLLVCLSLIMATSTRFKRLAILKWLRGRRDTVGSNFSSNQLVAEDSAVNNIGQGFISR